MAKKKIPIIKVVRKKGMYCVLGERIKSTNGRWRKLGCYKDKKQARYRMHQIEGFVMGKKGKKKEKK